MWRKDKGEQMLRKSHAELGTRDMQKDQRAQQMQCGQKVRGIPGKARCRTQIRGVVQAQAAASDRGTLQWMILPACFVIPVLIMLVVFIIDEIYPFGDRTFLSGDLYHQYMPFFQEFVRKIKSGEGLSYSYNVGIGSNFLVLYGYYLASPLHWLAFLFPEEHLIEFISYLVVVKIGLCGLTSGIYLREHFHCRNVGVLFVAIFYALSGYTAAYNYNIMWLDCVILLPLIVLGLEKLVKEGKCALYCVTLGLSILTNFYISIMICIFMVLYFVLLLVTEKRSFRILGNFILFSLLAGGMAAVLLVPEVLAILETDFGNMDFPTELESYFSVLDMLARHCVCVMTEKKLDHWPNIYCGAMVFLLIPLYTINDKIPMRRRFCFLGLSGFMLLSFSTNVLEFIWHGFNYPDSLPARQSFIYIFLVLIMCFEAFRDIRQIAPRKILYAYLAAVVFLLYCEEFVDHEDFYPGVKFLTLVFVTAYAVMLYLYRVRGKDPFVRDVLVSVALCTVILESGVNTGVTSVSTVSRSAYLSSLEDYQALYAYAQEVAEEEGQTFFRLEKFSRKTKNDGTLAGYPTASVFSSTMNSYVMDLYQRWGMRRSKVYYGYDGATFFTSALLNVQFMYGTDEQDEGPLYMLLENSGDISLYESAYTLPFGYVAPTGYDLSTGYSNNGLLLQNNMVAELGVEGSLFSKVMDGGKTEEVTYVASETGYYYALVTASGTSRISMTGAITRSYSDLKIGSVLYLGYLEEGESVTLENGSDDDSTPAIAVDFYLMDEEVLAQAIDVLSQESMTNVTYDSTHLSGDITLQEDGRLILSIPYEKGWTVVVDGKEVEPSTFGGTLIALDLEAGSHTIYMSYTPYGLYAGIFISIGSVVIFVMVLLWRRRKKENGGKLQDGSESNTDGDDADKAETDGDIADAGSTNEDNANGENADGDIAGDKAEKERIAGGSTGEDCRKACLA